MKLGWVAWEADRGQQDTRVAIDSEILNPWAWSGTGLIGGNPGNAADSTAFGSAFSNSLGTDVKAFKPASVGAGAHVLDVYSGGDSFLLDTMLLTITPEAGLVD